MIRRTGHEIKMNYREAVAEETKSKGSWTMKFHENLDLHVKPEKFIGKCDPSTTKEITKNRLQRCADMGLSIADLITGFSSTEKQHPYLFVKA